MTLSKKYKYAYEVGCDEAGRGCLAGPVVAAAVLLNIKKKIHPAIHDSKTLSPEKRAELFDWIQQHALAYGIGVVGPKEIDKTNILQASFRAMHFALDQLIIQPRHILVDGNGFIPYQDIPHTCLIKGDGKYYSIAAASILAKHFRDQLMLGLHTKYAVYGWNSNMGYPTLFHRQAVFQHGFTKHHRKSFRVRDLQGRLFQP